MRRLVIMTAVMTGLGVYALANPARFSTAERLAYNPKFNELPVNKYVSRFLKACGAFCNDRTHTDFAAGDIKSKNTAAVCVQFTFGKATNLDNFIIIDRKFWADPLQVGVHNMMKETETARYAIISHESLHCYKQLGHRDKGLMKPTPDVYKSQEEVDKLIKEEIKYALNGGQYHDINHDGRPSKGW